MYILEQLWKDGLAPNERCIRKDSEYHQIFLKACAEGDKLCEELSEEGRTHFDQYRQAYIDMTTIAEREIFLEAFRLGAWFVLDIVGEYHGNFMASNEA